jgi:hypothetical protein
MWTTTAFKSKVPQYAKQNKFLKDLQLEIPYEISEHQDFKIISLKLIKDV